MHIKPSGSQPHEPYKSAQPEVTYTRHTEGKAVSVDVGTLKESDQKTLSLIKDSIQKINVPAGSYSLTKEGMIINNKTGERFAITSKYFAEKAILILKGSDSSAVVNIELKSAKPLPKRGKPLPKKLTKSDAKVPPRALTPAPAKPDPKAATGLKHIITEHFETEKSFYNSFAGVANALNNDRTAFVESLKKNGVTDEEIKLIFEPLIEVSGKVGAFRDELGQIKEQLREAVTSSDYHNVIERYNQLIKTHYPDYAESMHKLMLAQKYFTEFGKQVVKDKQTNRFSEAVDKYFKEKDITNAFGQAGLHLTDTMIGFVQRLPRHELLFKDANEKSTTLGAGHAETLALIKTENAAVASDMPSAAKLAITEDQFSTQLKVDLKKNGWKEADVKKFIEIYNKYTKEAESLETLYFLQQKFPSNYRLSSELHSLAKTKQKTLESLNTQLEKWGGSVKLGQLKESQELFEDKLNFGKELEEKLALIEKIYIDVTQLSKNPVTRRLLNSPATKKFPKEWEFHLKQNGWSHKDIDRFNMIYSKHAGAYSELQIAYLKAGENLDDPIFKKEAKKIIPKMQAAQKEFEQFGGFAKTEKLFNALDEMRQYIGNEKELIDSLAQADFHAEMHKQIAFSEVISRNL